jgi:hypothetical protein
MLDPIKVIKAIRSVRADVQRNLDTRKEVSSLNPVAAALTESSFHPITALAALDQAEERVLALTNPDPYEAQIESAVLNYGQGETVMCKCEVKPAADRFFAHEAHQRDCPVRVDLIKRTAPPEPDDPMRDRYDAARTRALALHGALLELYLLAKDVDQMHPPAGWADALTKAEALLFPKQENPDER